MREALKRIKPVERPVFIMLSALSSAFVIFLYFYNTSFLATLELKAADAMFAARRAASPSPDVVIVAVDEKSINELGRWPWSRSRTAALIRGLKGARTIALDMVFSEPEAKGPDTELSEALREAGNVVEGFFFRDDSTDEPIKGALDEIKRARISLVRYIGGADEAAFSGPAFSGVEANIRVVARGAASFGSFNIIPDEDGIYRKAHLLFRYGGDLYPSLALEAARRYLGADPLVSIAPYGVDGLQLNETSVPVDENGGLVLNFYGRSSFKTYSASDVVAGRIDASAFAGRLVFAGVTEKAIYDIRPTPVDPLFPGVEIHATAASSIIQKRFLIHDTRVALYDLSMVVLLPFLLSLIIARARRTFLSLLAVSGILTLLVAGDFILFSVYNIRAGIVYPALALAFTYLTGEAYRNVAVEKRSRYLRKAFSTYVSSEVVSEILKDPARLKLGGEKRVVTVLFSDIRGFTALSERLKPDELVKLLNEYLNPMTVIVHSEGGMLDKYIGDAIMAVFNAPLPLEDHAMRACSSALKMIEKLNELNRGWRIRDYPALEVGVGINTGEAIVGNMGAELRFDYTAIGDTVNLSSRLEGLNKVYGTAVIVSEYTRELVKERFVFRELDRVKVVGKASPVVVYELMGLDGMEKGLEISGLFKEALSLYREKRFVEAKELFRGLYEKYKDPPSGLYMKRCERYIITAPDSDWDGSFSAETK